MKINKRAKVILIGIVIMLFIATVLFFSFSIKVPVGYTAIEVDVYGKNVEPKGLHNGRSFVDIITHDVFKYPIFIQQTEYENLKSQDQDGLIIISDIIWIINLMKQE